MKKKMKFYNFDTPKGRYVIRAYNLLNALIKIKEEDLEKYTYVGYTLTRTSKELIIKFD